MTAPPGKLTVGSGTLNLGGNIKGKPGGDGLGCHARAEVLVARCHCGLVRSRSTWARGLRMWSRGGGQRATGREARVSA